MDSSKKEEQSGNEKLEDHVFKINFNEGLYSYSAANGWVECSQIRVYYAKILPENAVGKAVRRNLAMRILSNRAELSMSQRKSRLLIDKLDISLNFYYQVHYYDKATFEKEFNNEKKNEDLLRDCPSFIIDLGLKNIEKDESNHMFLGCDCTDKDSNKKISDLITRLCFEIRYSDIAIVHQVEERLYNNLYLILKEIVKFYVNSDECILKEMRKLIGAPINFKADYEEILSIVYKIIISEGLFPIYCEINTMDDSWLKLFCLNCCIPDAVLPWSSKFHASFLIGDLHYSFTPNHRMNTSLLKNRKYRNKKFNYIRIKLLDFFPLDKWITDIADFFISNVLPDILEPEIGDFLNFDEEEILQMERKNETINPMQMMQPMEQLEINVASVRPELTEPLIGNEPNYDASSRLWRNRKIKKKINPVTSLIIRKKKDKLKDFLFKCEPGKKLVGRIAEEFHKNYKFELKFTQILRKFCKIIANTEIKKYQACKNNCQTPVAEIVFSIHESLQPFIEPLPETKDFNLSKEIYKKHYLKFASRKMRRLIEDHTIKPVILDCSLDYFGIYADRKMKSYLDNLKNFDFFEKPEVINKKIGKEYDKYQHNFSKFYDLYFGPGKEESTSDMVGPLQIVLSTQREIEKKDLNSEISYYMFLAQNKSLDFHKQIKYNKLQGHTVIDPLLKENRRKFKILYREFCFLYFNSIRMKNSQKQNKNNISYIGNLIIKDPSMLLDTFPENSNPIYNLLK